MADASNPIVTAVEYAERLAALLANKNGAAFPRRQRDKNILLRCIIQSLRIGKNCSEQELNEALLLWLSDYGSGIDVDHVTLRRYLVDEGYRMRAANGSGYNPSLTGHGRVACEDAVAAIDSDRVIQAERDAAAARSEKWRNAIL